MKKLNLKDIKNGMSRSEMRAVKGGCGNITCNIVASWCGSGRAYKENWGTGSGTQLYCCS